MSRIHNTVLYVQYASQISPSPFTSLRGYFEYEDFRLVEPLPEIYDKLLTMFMYRKKKKKKDPPPPSLTQIWRR